MRPGALVIVLAALFGALSPCEPARAQAPAPAERATTSRISRAANELAVWAEKAGGHASVTVLDLSSGEVLAQHGAERAVNPASNIKLVTAAAALKRLGQSHRFRTGLYGKIRDGVATELVLRGDGDPSFDTRALAALCRAAIARGLRRVEGRVLVDQSRFDDQFVPPAFEQQPGEWAGFRAPVSAVAIEQNTVTLNVQGTEPGQAARVWFEPPGAVEITGAVDTRDAGSGQDVKLSLRGEGGRLRATLRGHVAEGLGLLRFRRRMDDPRLVPGFVLARLLRDAGVDVKGDVALGGERERTPIAVHTSPPLSSLLAELGKQSDNFYAEMLFKALGAARSGAQARSSDGAAAVASWLESVGAADSATRITNGSGLFDANRVTTMTLARALVAAHNDPAIGPEFVAQLAVGGVDGTLRSRFREYRQSRRVRAKTGTLNDVDALSGLAFAQDARRGAAFSVVVSTISDHHQSRRHIDAVVRAVLKSLDEGA